MGLLKKIDNPAQRKLAFSSPEKIHGAVKQIIGWVEMQSIQYKGKSLTEKDFLNSLIAGFYMSGQSNWEEMIEKNLSALESMTKPVIEKKKTN